MFSGDATSPNLNGTPIFVGGSEPTTYAGYRLAPDSPGKNAAHDGTDIGARIDGNVTSLDVPGVNGTPANYTVKAVDAANLDGADSNEVAVTPNGPLPAPTLDGKPGDGVAKLSWTAVTGADHYMVTTVGGETQRVDGTVTSLDVPGRNGTSAKY